MPERSSKGHESGMARPASAKRRTCSVVIEAPSEEGHVEPTEPPRSSGMRANVLWVGAKLLLGMALVLGAAGGVAWGAHHFLVTTARFSIERVEVEGSHRFGQAELLRLMGTERGANLFALELSEAERALVRNPWIEHAKLSRKLPRTLHIQLRERRARAIAAVEQTLYLVTADGQPIKRLVEDDPVDLPVISGVTRDEWAVDRRGARERLALAIQVLDDYERLTLAKAFEPQAVHLGPDGQLELVVGASAVTLQLGKRDFRQKLLMAARVLGRVQARGEIPEVIFLDNEAHPERVVVRLR